MVSEGLQARFGYLKRKKRGLDFLVVGFLLIQRKVYCNSFFFFSIHGSEPVTVAPN